VKELKKKKRLTATEASEKKAREDLEHETSSNAANVKELEELHSVAATPARERSQRSCRKTLVDRGGYELRLLTFDDGSVFETWATSRRRRRSQFLLFLLTFGIAGEGVKRPGLGKIW
jgi:hypothetical protein